MRLLTVLIVSAGVFFIVATGLQDGMLGPAIFLSLIVVAVGLMASW